MAVKAGTLGTIRREIGIELSAETLGNPGVNVLGTPCLAELCDEAARVACDDEATGPLRVDIRHLAATPIGDTVEIVAEVIADNDRRIRCRVTGRDSSRDIVEGHVERRRL